MDKHRGRPVETHRRRRHLHTTRRGLRRDNASAFIMDLQPPRLRDSKGLLCKLPRLRHFATAAPANEPSIL